MNRTMHPSLIAVALLATSLAASSAHAVDLKAGDAAPLFSAKTHDGSDFNLADRKGKWTVLFFYPKANTPGCTKQACAFRDGIESIRSEGAEVYGISTDTIEKQAAFHKEQNLSFPLLADPEGTVTSAYGAKMPVLTVAKRWTFIIDPSLTIRQVEHDVDPAEDAQRVAAEIKRLQSGSVTSDADP